MDCFYPTCLRQTHRFLAGTLPAQLKGLIAVVALFATAGATQAEVVKITFDNVQAEKGQLLLLASSTEEGFTNWREADVAKIVPMAEAAKDGITLELPPGTYAIAVIQDLNDNQKLDKTFIGMPKEPFGFSTNPKIRFGPPGFDDCLFEVEAEAILELTIRLAG